MSEDRDQVPEIPGRRRWTAGVAVALLAGGFAAWAISPVAFDDAFISYRYAENLVQGHGLVFNPGERVEGYTNFLWVIVSAAALRVGIDPFLVNRILGLAGYFACVLMAVAAAGRVASGASRARTVGLVWIVSVLVVSRDVARLAGAGLETFFVAACLLGTGVAFHLRAPSRAAEIGWSVLPLAAVLTRMDAILGVVASMVATLVEPGIRRAPWPTLARRYGLPVLGIAGLTIWRLGYYGDIVPNSFYAKDAGGWHLRAGLAYLAGYVMNSPSVVVLAGLAIVGLRAAWPTEHRSWPVFLCSFLLLHTSYVVKVGGDFMYYRFMFEALPFLVCAAALGFASLKVARERTAVIVAASCVVLSVTPRHLEESYAMQSLWEMNSYVERGREVGLRLREVLPTDTRIATTLAGTIPYYSGLFTVDQWGLNDASVARLAGREDFRRGHLKWAPIDYLLDQRVNLVIDHPMVCPCGDPCGQGRPHVFVRLSGDRCLRTTYLFERPYLTRHFCANTKDFVLQNVPCY